MDSYKYGYYSIFLINDMHKIHYDNIKTGHPTENGSIKLALKKIGMKRIFLPPGSPQLNPVEIMVAYLKKLLFLEKDKITTCEILKQRLTKHMQDIANEPTKRFFFEF